MKTAIKKEVTNKDTSKPDNEKVTYPVTSAKVNDAIDSYAMNKKIVEDALAEMEKADNVIRDYGRRIYAQLLTKNGQQPDSFSFQSQKGNSIMYIVQDTYLAELTPASIKDFKDRFGSSIITVNEKNTISPAFMKKYGKELKALIQKSKVITEADKPVIVKVTKESIISKGTIEQIPALVKKTGIGALELMNTFIPKEQLKMVVKKDK